MNCESFRDPLGSVRIEKERVCRTIRPEAASIVAFANEIHRTHPDRIVESRFETETKVVHPKLFFPSYPAEWSASHLWQAAFNTLMILEASLEKGCTLKDGSAYNILFQNANPVFIDVLSFETLGENSPFWLGYGQFCRHFIYPLVIHREKGIEISKLFKAYPNGLTPAETKKFISWKSSLKPSIFFDLYLIGWLGKLEQKIKGAIERTARKIDPVKVQRSVLVSLRKRLELLKPREQQSFWKNYLLDRSHYSREALGDKTRAVEQFLEEVKPKAVLDLGCNRGEYSLIAARKKILTVGVDFDEACIDSLYTAAFNEKLPLLPLVMDLALPTPEAGFFQVERSSFLNRIRGHFDAIFCLSLIHHLILCERIPLTLFFGFLKNAQARYLLLEWVGPNDEMARKVSSYSKDRLPQLEKNFFEETAKRYAAILRKIPLTNTERALYVLEFP